MLEHKNVNTKVKLNLSTLYSKKFLVLFSLFFMTVLIFSPLSFMVNEVSAVSDVAVGSETELLKAIEAAPDNVEYVIGFKKDIVLEKTLEIPISKNISLVNTGGTWTLTGPTFGSIITVTGVLTIDGVNLTYVRPDDGIFNGNGVCIMSGGTFNFVSGKISNGYVDGWGGGVYNLGVFTMSGGEISGNAAWTGGGVYNSGVFTMSGGRISNNAAGDGAGVYNLGSFTMLSGEIVDNVGGGVCTDGGTFEWLDGVIANNTCYDGEVSDVYVVGGLSAESSFLGGMWWCFLLLVIVVGVVVSLLFYRSKKQKHPTTNNLTNSFTT